MKASRSQKRARAAAKKNTFVQLLKLEGYFVDWIENLDTNFIVKVFLSKNLLIDGHQKELPKWIIDSEILHIGCQIHQYLLKH